MTTAVSLFTATWGIVAAPDLTIRPRKTKEERSARPPALVGADCCRLSKAAKSNRQCILPPMLLGSSRRYCHSPQGIGLATVGSIDRRFGDRIAHAWWRWWSFLPHNRFM